jgi:hypothetical protein
MQLFCVFHQQRKYHALCLSQCQVKVIFQDNFPGIFLADFITSHYVKYDVHIDGGILFSKTWATSAPKVVRSNENQYYTIFPVIYVTIAMKNLNSFY